MLTKHNRQNRWANHTADLLLVDRNGQRGRAAKAIGLWWDTASVAGSMMSDSFSYRMSARWMRALPPCRRPLAP